MNIENVQDASFINSVLYIFLSFYEIKIWYQNINSNQNQIKFNSIFTKELFKLLTSLYNNQDPDSSNFFIIIII